MKARLPISSTGDVTFDRDEADQISVPKFEISVRHIGVVLFYSIGVILFFIALK